MVRRDDADLRPWALGLVLALSCNAPAAGTPVSLPGASLGRVLAPAGRTGQLDLLDPDTFAVDTIGGFGTAGGYGGGHDDGPTSVDEGEAWLFVTDRTTRLLNVVDPRARTVVASVPVAASPDYVRWVASTRELWVTEPGAGQVEIFSLPASGAPAPSHSGSVAIANGPESMVVDAIRGRAYVHRWQSSTVAIDVASRSVVAEWPNACAASRGIALDESRGLLIVACDEGTVSVLDVDQGGAIRSTLAVGSGFDVVGYDAARAHLYAAGPACRCLMMFGIDGKGSLSLLGRFDAPSASHCATADGRGHAWVCDPDGGRLWRVDDPFPASVP
jgi:DNA-binding beta-propeller fold protein YncE